jgi:hypothetical protein
MSSGSDWAKVEVAKRSVAATFDACDSLGLKWIMGHPPRMAKVLTGCFTQSQGMTYGMNLTAT